MGSNSSPLVDFKKGEIFRFDKGSAVGARLEGPTKDVSQLLSVDTWDALVSGGGGGEIFRFDKDSGGRKTYLQNYLLTELGS